MLEKFMNKIVKVIRFVFRLILQPNKISIRGDIVSFPSNISKELKSALYTEKYESKEVDSMRKVCNPSDRIMDIGASIGCVTMAACHLVGSKNVTSIEANPSLEKFARANFNANNLSPEYIVGLASNTTGKEKFKMSVDFWSSSVITDRKDDDQFSQVDKIDCNALIKEKKINTIICDIEGYEKILIPQLNLDPIDKVIIELHPDIYGNSDCSKLIVYLLQSGFNYLSQKSNGDVFVFIKCDNDLM